MAPVTEPPRSAQVALLELEKGSNAPASQLNEAAQIIGIDLRAHEARIYERGESAEIQPTTASAPKEEWVLRWLMKKLKATNGPLNYKLDSDSWLLLRILFDRIPPKTIAAILNEFKFLGILENALLDLDKFSGEDGLPGSEDRVAEASKCQKRGHKRKRVEVEAESSDSTITQEFTPSSWASTLLSVLVSIQRLAVLSTQSYGVDWTSQSHLKLALRAEPQVAANILGMSFKIARSALQVLADAPESNTPQRLLAVLPSVFDIWDLRSSSQNGSTKNQSDATSCSTFFLQALQLLSTLQRLPSTFSQKDDVVRPIEQTVALHVVLPARAEFFSKHASGITSIDQKPDMGLIKPVISNLRSSFGDKSTDDHVSKPLAASRDLLPTLLDIAIRSVPRDTFKRQNDEAPWLEALFISLAELAGCPLEAEIPLEDTASSRNILEDLFRVVIERKISISLKTLSAFTSRFTGLLDSEADQVAWSLISKLISVGVDVFLPNSGLKDSKPLLEGLLGHIRRFSLNPSFPDVSSQKESYETIKSGIIIPLLHGFASARDITTFAELWFEQLVATRSNEHQLPSVWEDDDVSAAYGISSSKSLSDNQIISQTQTIFKELGNVDKSAETFARVVILDSITISEMRVDGTTEIKETYESILKAITSTIASKEKPQWRWRLWRLARNILDKRLRWVDTSSANLEETLIGEAAKFSSKKLNSGLGTDEYREALEVFKFTMFALGMANDDRYASQVESVFTQVVSLLRKVRSLDNSSSDSSSSEGSLQTVNSPQKLAIGYLTVLLSKPATVVRLTSDQRRLLFEEMFFLGAMAPAKQLNQQSESGKPIDSSEITFRRIWDGFISYRWLLDAQLAAYDIIEVLSARIKQDAGSLPFIISSMVNVPARLIPRHQRGKVLDLLQDVLLNGQDLGSEMYIEIFAFTTSLVNQPKSSAQITNDPEALWKIAESFNLPGTDADQLIRQSFRNLHQAVLDGFLVASDEQRHKYFELSFSNSRSIVDKLDTIDYTSMAFFMARISLSSQSSHRKEAEASPKVEDVNAIRQKVFELILKDLKSSRKLLMKGDGNILETKLRDILDAFEDFEDIAQGNKDVHKLLKKTEEEIVETKGFDSDTSLQRLVKRRVLSTQKPEKNIVRPLIQCSNIFPIQQLNQEEQRVFFGETRQRLSSMSTEKIVEFIHDVQKPGFSGDDAPYRLLLVGMAATCCKAIEDRDSSESGELTSLFTAVTECLHGSRSIEQFSLATECLDVLLRTQSRSITQWNIDNVLGAILISTTRSGPQIPSDQAGIIYGRLCRLMGTLINLYRRKLGGRFHLILPVTQGLLRCLFTTGSQHRKSTRAQPDQPPWLASSNSGLTTEHAVQYTRVITSICDPTMSAVHTQRGPGGSDLTDPTKKAKRVAGQHLQYLVMDYAQCQLRSSLTPDMKAALMPALYAVLDVMSKDTMRTMNAAMDSSSRAVFKGLYDDYNRFGKWNKN